MQPDIEKNRHQCEVRQLIRWRIQHGSEWAQSWLTDVVKQRGKQAADALQRDAASQWKAGNRGDPSDWR